MVCDARVEGPLTARESDGSEPDRPGRASGLSEPWCRNDPLGAQVAAGQIREADGKLKHETVCGPQVRAN